MFAGQIVHVSLSSDEEHMVFTAQEKVTLVDAAALCARLRLHLEASDKGKELLARAWHDVNE